MADLTKLAFAGALHDFMAQDRAAFCKQAAPMPPGMPPQGAYMDPAMMQDPSMQGAPAPEEQGAQQTPQETLNIQAKGPEAIDAIKSMMGNAGVQPTQEELMQQLPPEVLAQMQAGMPPKMAAFKASLSEFMQADKQAALNKRAAAGRIAAARENVMDMIRAASRSY